MKGLWWLPALPLMTACVVRTAARPQQAMSESRSVQVVHPVRADLVERLSFTGFIEPRLLMNLNFLVAGRLDFCRVREGQKVRQGDELCRLDTSVINLEVGRTANSVKAAKKVLETNLPEKQKALFEAGVIGQSEFEQVRIQSESAKAQFSDASSLHELALKKQREHILMAPWDATVMRLLAKPGQPVVPELPIAVLSDERTIQVGVDVHAGYFSKLMVGAKAMVTNVSSLVLESPLAFLVAEKATAVSPETQSFHVTLRPSAPAAVEGFTSGMLVGGELHIRRRDQVLSIPQSALLSWKQTGEATVFVVQDGFVESRAVRTGTLDEGRIEVRAGLEEHDQVVLGASADLAVGMRVEGVRELPH